MLRLVLSIFLAALWLQSHAKTTFKFAGSKVELLDSTEAAGLNGISDSYTRKLTPFDLSIRMDVPTGATEDGYLRRAAAAVRNWSQEEAAKLRTVFEGVAAGLRKHRLRIPLPPVIQVVKTDGSEEFSAEGYTRGTRIMLNTGAEPASVHLVAHELFHVISRSSPVLRDSVYAVFGFNPCWGFDVVAALAGRSITNPDCPDVGHCIALSDRNVLRQYALVLYSKRDYSPGGGLGEYASIGLLELSGTGASVGVPMQDGRPVVRELASMPAFFEKVGRNTQYLLHPEEISAEHFAMLVAGENAREPKYLEAVRAVLRNP